VLALGPRPGAAEGPAPAPPDAEASPAGDARPDSSAGPELDRLLRPRSDRPSAPAEGVRGGRDKDAWREQFEALDAEIQVLEARIAAKQEKLREASQGGYQFAPPGAGAPTDPEVLRLRTEIKRDRTSLEASQRRLRELEIEASLAGVPRDWIER
jgi:hypothetical protein